MQSFAGVSARSTSSSRRASSSARHDRAVERARVDLGDLLDGAVFDERTGAVAISHGESSFLSTAAGEGAAEGREFSFAGGLNSYL